MMYMYDIGYNVTFCAIMDLSCIHDSLLYVIFNMFICLIFLTNVFDKTKS